MSFSIVTVGGSVGKTGSYYYSYGARFSVPILQGATITDAVLSFRASSPGEGNPVFTVAAEDIDDAGEFQATTHTPYTCYNTRTANEKNWTVGAWVGDKWYNSPNINTVVQELCGREGWTEESHAAFILYLSSADGDGTRGIRHYDSNPSYGAKFNCTYTEGGGSAVPAIMHHYRQLRSR
jgi:hypothetical protein